MKVNDIKVDKISFELFLDLAKILFKLKLNPNTTARLSSRIVCSIWMNIILISSSIKSSNLSNLLYLILTVRPVYLEHVDNWLLKLILYYSNRYIFKNQLSTCST